MSEYDQQVQEFLDKHDLSVSITFKDTVYKWENYRNKYQVTLRRKNGKTFTYQFFDSVNNYLQGNRPTKYDVIATLSMESYIPYGDKYDFFEEFGYNPSRENEKIYYAVLKLSKRINKFFKKNELEDLREIN